MNWCKFLWTNPRKAIETVYHWDSFLWDFGFSTYFYHTAAWKKSETDSAVSILLAVGFPMPVISKNSMSTLFCPLILDHGVCLIISVFDPKIPVRKSCSKLLFTIVFNLWSSSLMFFWWISRSYNSSTVLSFSDSRILYLYYPSKMTSHGIFVIDNRIPLHFESNSWISSIWRTVTSRSA